MQVAITASGSILYFDWTTQRIRHGEATAAPPNLYFTQTAEGHDAYVAPPDEPGTLRRLRSIDPAGIGSFADAGGTDTLALRDAPQSGCTVLSWGARSLVTEDNGNVRLYVGGLAIASPLCLIAGATLTVLRALLTDRWLFLHDQRVVSPTPDHRIEAFHLQFDRMRIDLRDFDANVRVVDAAKTGGVPRHVAFRIDGWKYAEALRLRPLIYFCAYGAEAIYHCLHIALKSLIEFGQYDGDIMIVTDAPRHGVIAYVPGPIRERVLIRHVPASGLAGYATARYRVEEFGIEDYQPVLYLDTDIVCDMPVLPLIKRLALSTSICGTIEPQAAEVPPDVQIDDLEGIQGDYYGKWLFAEDSQRISDWHAVPMSSCAIAARNVTCLAARFAAVMRCFDAYMQQDGHRDLGPHGFDQPLFNYVAHKTRSVDVTILSPVIQFMRLGRPLDPARRQGFFHFQGGVGHFGHKLGLMQEYYVQLCRAQ